MLKYMKNYRYLEPVNLKGNDSNNKKQNFV